MKIYIFGAKSIAIGICKAVRVLQPEVKILGFLVTSLIDNPQELEGLSVQELGKISKELKREEKQEICVYIAVPEIVHKQIIENLEQYGFENYKPINSKIEEEWMEQYYKKLNKFPSLHGLTMGEKAAVLSVYAARFCKDTVLVHPPVFSNYVSTIMLGCEGNPDKSLEEKVDFHDNAGDHISDKNPDYCEMTAFYWVWKNRNFALETVDYVGICHYRRVLDIQEDDRCKLLKNQVDVVLPFPMIHLPNIKEHHNRYMSEEEWQIMLQALKELYPDYAKEYENIFSGIYFYNYNLILARQKVFSDYCAWIFPLLFRTEELCVPHGVKRTGRYLAYMSESLLTLYFLYHSELKIYHTGRLLFT